MNHTRFFRFCVSYVLISNYLSVKLYLLYHITVKTMFGLRNKKIHFYSHTLIQNPDEWIHCFHIGQIGTVSKIMHFSNKGHDVRKPDIVSCEKQRHSLVYVPSKDSDLPVYQHSLVIVFAWPSMCSHGTNNSS